MAKTKETKYFLAFMDLLGTQQLASRHYDKFFESLHDFEQALHVNSFRLEPGAGHVYYFSDCAYIESRDLASLLEFLSNVRGILLRKGFYFTAAVGNGRLEPLIGTVRKEGSKRGKPIVAGVRFGRDVVRVYGAQASLRGIGIRLLPEILGDVPPGMAVPNCHLPVDSSRRLEAFYDLRLDADFDLDYEVLRIFVKHLYGWSSISRRIARKYVSFLICVIQSSNFRDCRWDERDTVPRVYKFLRSGAFLRHVAQVPGIECAYYAVLNKMLTECEDEDLQREALDIIIGRRRFVEQLEQVPVTLFPDEYRRILVDRIQSKLEDLARHTCPTDEALHEDER